LLNLAAAMLLTSRVAAGEPGKMPLCVLCGTGDHRWVRDRDPVDSPETIEAMVQWMSRTYSLKRLYRRGAQMHVWDQYYQVGETLPQQHDWWRWVQRLNRDLKINEAAVASTKRHRMEVFLYTGLFERGVQPDVGMICPYPFEDKLRIEHLEWCMLDYLLGREIAAGREAAWPPAAPAGRVPIGLNLKASEAPELKVDPVAWPGTREVNGLPVSAFAVVYPADCQAALEQARHLAGAEDALGLQPWRVRDCPACWSW